ncbi:MAG: bestrophin family ion channel [Deltaproteobacteria bacterium]|nr:bestrophin family ion channel [Deltaproteobacteria bacterium]
MMVSNQGSFFRVVFQWQWKHSAIYLGAGLLAWLCVDVLELKAAKLPASPAAIAGAALGIFASFRANAAYARWWEGRGLWGKLVNLSRHFATQTTTYLVDAARKRRVVLRHALYVHVLRCQLRDDDAFADDNVQRLLALLAVDDDTIAAWKTQSSLGHALLDMNLKDIAAEPELDVRKLQAIDQTIAGLLDAQGGAERIKRTPMPRSYGFFVERMLFIFALLFPFTIVADISWAVIPVNLLVCIGFTLISETGRVLEDPFTHFWNSLPITNLSTNIERNMRQRLDGKEEIPPAVAVDKIGILW